MIQAREMPLPQRRRGRGLRLWWLAGCMFIALLFTALRPAAAATLVMFMSETCPYCERWMKDIGVVYNKTDEGRIAPLRIVDIHEPRPKDLEHIRGIYWTPTFVLLDDAGREVGRIEGYNTEYGFWSRLDNLLKKLPREKNRPEKAGAAAADDGG